MEKWNSFVAWFKVNVSPKWDGLKTRTQIIIVIGSFVAGWLLG